jgi:predicted DNA-binding transcriptional regulator AlpA
MIGMDHKYFSEKFIFESKDFPKAFRFTPAGRRRWLRTEILKWIKSKREAA